MLYDKTYNNFSLVQELCFVSLMPCDLCLNDVCLDDLYVMAVVTMHDCVSCTTNHGHMSRFLRWRLATFHMSPMSRFYDTMYD